ncbi:SDR family oxidoreductase [Pedobacter metabolipauper]|uniref:Nucleoside-diphosphate-sugar epimerase n=1 Tax=Pedobacter metabolipauper TaxID=425513 RepID=A0A4R6T3S4_9SPHI|nr:SDR family oxidoreductase [Pedobacter metabolipauper]TDQ12021.1 nucleoside-diphosphate-sugar epimerase [Pedobacter metabolipauper]
MNKTISILGCGWYGFALSKVLIAKNYQVKGSTTQKDKTAMLQKEGIEPYIVSFEADAQQYDPAFFDSNVLIICIPPKRSTAEQGSYPDKVKAIAQAVKESRIQQVIFISSTSVYGDSNSTLTESERPDPDTASGKAMLESEQYLQSQSAFSTTVIRFAGLIGPGRNPGRFFAGKEKVPNGLAPINLIHLDDCIGITMAILEKEAFGYLINASSPDHTQRAEFYTTAALNAGLPVPTFIKELKNWKIISSNIVPSTLKYKYLVTNLTDWITKDN